MDHLLHSASQLSTHIKSLRQARGLSQAQLGRLLNVGQVRIAEIEKNPGVVSIDQILKILQVLDTRLLLRPRTEQIERAQADTQADTQADIQADRQAKATRAEW